MSAAAYPQVWKYVLAGVLLTVVAVPLWTWIVMWGVQPEYLIQETELKTKHFVWLVAVPVLLVLLLTYGLWFESSTQAIEQNVEVKKALLAQKAGQAAQQAERSRREYTLEVIGLGVTLDQYRQGSLWNALRQGSPYATIREQDPKKYPWGAQEKKGLDGLRSAHSLENGAGPTTEY